MVFGRVKTIFSSYTLYKQEITNLKESFIKFGYCKKFVDDIIQRSVNNKDTCK